MKNILITGSVLNSNIKSIEIYEKLVEIFDNNKYKVHSPLDTMKFTGNDEERYKRAMKYVNEADFIIAEMSTPSTGQGMELQQAMINKKPLLIIAKKDSKISSLIKGSKSVTDILFYDKIEDVLQDIINITETI